MSSITHRADTSISALTLNERNARSTQIARSNTEFDFTTPIIADENGVIIAGHGRLEAARSLGLGVVPVITVAGLSDAFKRALLLADNKIAGNAGWDRQKLAFKIPELSAQLEIEGSDITLTGFDFPKIDQFMVDFGGPELDRTETFPIRRRPPNAGLSRLTRQFTWTSGLPGWRRSADRTGLHRNSLQTGNFTGNFAKFALLEKSRRRKLLSHSHFAANSLAGE